MYTAGYIKGNAVRGKMQLVECWIRLAHRPNSFPNGLATAKQPCSHATYCYLLLIGLPLMLEAVRVGRPGGLVLMLAANWCRVRPYDADELLYCSAAPSSPVHFAE